MNSMKKIAMFVMVFTSSALITTQQGKAQQYATTANNCLRSYYDPASYNWLTYQNNCAKALYVTLVSNSGTNVGSLDLNPGQHNGPGLSATEVRNLGGVQAYACPAGYRAVDTNDEVISNQPVSTFRCKQT